MSRFGVFPSPESVRKHIRAVAQLQREMSSVLAALGSQDRFKTPAETIVFCNKGAAAVPPFGIVQVTGNEMGQLKGERPADSYGRSGCYIVNGPTEVAVNAYGIAFRGVMPIVCDATTYVKGDRLRAVASSYEASKHPCGNFLVIGDYALRSQTDLFLCCDVGFPQVIKFKSPSGIAARSGTTTITKGSATCDIWTSNGTAGQLIDSTFDETIYSLFTQAIAPNAFGLASLDAAGEWNALNWEQDCPVTDIRLNGSNLQQKRCGTWETWETVTDCPEA